MVFAVGDMAHRMHHVANMYTASQSADSSRSQGASVGSLEHSKCIARSNQIAIYIVDLSRLMVPTQLPGRPLAQSTVCRARFVYILDS